MADVCDQSDTHIEEVLAGAIESAMIRAQSIPPGAPGVCDLCGEWSGRLVSGVCAPCRDKFRLP